MVGVRHTGFLLPLPSNLFVWLAYTLSIQVAVLVGIIVEETGRLTDRAVIAHFPGGGFWNSSQRR